ncbi:Lysozyme g [Oryzias melastigma]|uniref:Lysozyme g n=1 Tax=Oryzias melastigma TaxID=30732 RepID=A0A834FPL0_ORYME|nr:Lysozyme g [Oryzias melastigma]
MRMLSARAAKVLRRRRMAGMKVAVFVSCCFQLVGCRMVPPQQTGGADSPAQVFAVVGRDVILRCDVPGLPDLLRVRTWEWLKEDGLKPALTVRGGVELKKDKEADYVNRTAPLVNRSMELRGVRLTDTAVYICRLSLEDRKTLETRVSLIVGEVSELSVAVHRSEDGGLVVLCEVHVRSLELTLEMLDDRGNTLQTQTQKWVGSDESRPVRVQEKVEPGGGNVTRICRWNVSEETEEKKVSVSGTAAAFVVMFSSGLDLHSLLLGFPDSSTSSGCSVLLSCLPLVIYSLLVTLAVGVFFGVKHRKRLPELWRKVTALTATAQRVPHEDEDEHFTEYRNLNQMTTTGISERTARGNNLTRGGELVLGAEGSRMLAEKDLRDMSKYRNQILNVGRKLHLHPALIAAMISKQSNAGRQLHPDGRGKHDDNCYGLMQINRNFHAVKGEPFSEDHIDEGATYLIHLIKTVSSWRPAWSREQHLKGEFELLFSELRVHGAEAPLCSGALVCYMVGLERERLNYPGDLDEQTPTQDFANDVIGRAQFYAQNQYTS